ncbi:MAG: hypothetical protein H6Q73_187 [Firmicutes bacterium]|nr:hypothetical protein [Bacillota bacterium]
MKWLKDFIWFVIASYGFMVGHRGINFWVTLVPKGIWFCKQQHAWRKLTPKQREAWYLSGEGRTIDIVC